MKRTVGFIAAALVLAGILFALWIIDPWGWGQGKNPDTAATAPSPSASAPLQDPDAQGAAEALSRLPENPADGISAVTKQSFDADVALPPGSKLAPEVSSWAPDGIGGGTMNVVMSVPGQADSRYVAVMVKEDGQWKLLGTMEQTETPGVTEGSEAP
ncbi:hypothetical protein ANMWB30_24210 [Arthrobacter sp. MWB30]|nr:hypothetical protein ANMWB30_24210 [Arthrobacter sp. MWB30]